MADITYTVKATDNKATADVVPGKGDAHNVKVLVSRQVELVAGATGRTVYFGRIPTNARLLGQSRVYWDDLATSGSPTLDLGLASVDANVTSDPDALSNGHAISSADADGAPAIGNPSDMGLYAWDLVNGVTSDPGGFLDVYGTILDAPTHTTGTIKVEILGYLD